jgi:Ca-activated chloride channel homolog
MTHAKLLITPLRAGIRAGCDNTIDILVRIQAPSPPKDQLCPRPPLHLSLTLDRSGSMSGRPIEVTKRCASFVVNRLREGDKVSLVAYDSDVQTLVPLTAVGNKSLLLDAIHSIRSKGSTALHRGWLAGAESLAGEASPATLSRVLLLSDGRANKGLRNPEAIWQHCEELARAGVTTSTCGTGRNFHEVLMTGMARAGRGHAYYGETAEDLFDSFIEELALLDRLFARQAELELYCPDGVSATILNDCPMLGRNRFQLPDIGYDSEAWAIVRLNVPVSVTVAGENINLLTVSAHYIGPSGERHSFPPETLNLPVVSSNHYAQLPRDTAVVSRLDELSAANLQDRARTAARNGNWQLVEQILEEADRVAGDHPWLIAVLKEMQRAARRRDKERFAKEATYTAHKLRSRLCSPNEAKHSSNEAVPEYARRKTAQGKGDLKDWTDLTP